jgi:Zn-dependent protease
VVFSRRSFRASKSLRVEACHAEGIEANFYARIRPLTHKRLGTFQSFLLIAPVFLISMVAHEYAHGYAALKQGDTTAYSLGRLTWNPIPHIDPFMSVLLPLATFIFSHGSMIFGGAKPVPVVPRNYRNYKRGDIIVSLAGVATNLLIAIICVPLIIFVGLIGGAIPAMVDSGALLQTMLRYGIIVNLVLLAFNLIPIPPLDGSHVFKYILPPAWALNYQRLGSQGLVILILLLSFGGPVLSIWLKPVFFLDQVAARAVMPYMLPSQWTM